MYILLHILNGFWLASIDLACEKDASDLGLVGGFLGYNGWLHI